ncbi:MAG: SGNH/GDSL hydrolase family protein [Planctomycetes bacterium]|nr:SGNH/GDSL hydrolase family protein [Planctomycetota bacterium]
MVCGDSFAFGTGVADDETWEIELERLDPRLETVNFGVGGYGLDQAWLRYRRDGARVEHRLVIVAFITEDLVRMVTPMPWGADRPWLGITGDELEVRNVPVIKSPHVLRSVRQAGFFARELYLGKVICRLAEDDAASRAADDREASMSQLTLRLITEFDALAQQRGAHVVFVHLPIESERGGGSIDALRSEFAAKAAAVGADWIDLLAEFRALSDADHARLFLHRPAAAAGHYDVAGTAFIGALLHQKLHALAAVKERLDTVGG